MEKPIKSKENRTAHADEAANKTIEDTKKQLGTIPGGDVHGAYNKLIESVRTTHADLIKKEKTGHAAKEYDRAVVSKLEHEKLLPALSLEYGQRAFDKISHKDSTKGGDARVTVSQLKEFKQNGKAGEFGKAMVDSLIAHSDEIKKAGDPKKDLKNTKAGFNQSDLSNALLSLQRAEEFTWGNKKAVDAKAQENRNQAEAKDLKKFLFDEKDGKPSLFTKADFDGSTDPRLRTDKIVSKDDFRALAMDPSLAASEKTELNNRVLKKWDEPDFKERYLNEDGYLTPDSIKKATGELAIELKEKQSKETTERQKQQDMLRQHEITNAKEIDTVLHRQVTSGVDVFQAADFAGSDKLDERTDKLVSKHDLEALVRSPGFDKDLAREINEKLISKMDSREFQTKYMNGGFLDTDLITKATGESDANDASDRAKFLAAKNEKSRQDSEKVVAEAQNKEEKNAEEMNKAKQLAAALIMQDRTGTSLLQRADYDGTTDPQRRTDGLVNRQDLEALSADPSLQKDQHDFIRDNFLGEKWNSEPVKRLRNGEYISRDSLKHYLKDSKQ